VLSQVIRTELPRTSGRWNAHRTAGSSFIGDRVIEAIKLYNQKAIQPNRSWNSERELSELRKGSRSEPAVPIGITFPLRQNRVQF
jgi:hypothetical protein